MQTITFKFQTISNGILECRWACTLPIQFSQNDVIYPWWPNADAMSPCWTSIKRNGCVFCPFSHLFTRIERMRYMQRKKIPRAIVSCRIHKSRHGCALCYVIWTIGASRIRSMGRTHDSIFGCESLIWLFKTKSDSDFASSFTARCSVFLFIIKRCIVDSWCLRLHLSFFSCSRRLQEITAIRIVFVHFACDKRSLKCAI